MDRTPDAHGFRHLWPTVFLERRLPGAEAANRVLAELIEKRDAEARAAGGDMTTDYLGDRGGGNFLAGDHPAVGWLRECVNKTAVDYLRHCGLDYAVSWTIQGWANVNRLGDYHDLHNHPHAYLSGTYYVATPDDVAPEAAQGRRDRRPGAISFYDPRPQANMTAIAGDPQVEAEHTVRPQAGTILLWPAFLHHFVHPNLSRSPRISVSFNLVLKRPGDHLPEQG